MQPTATKPFAKGDAVYYYSPAGDTVPATVLKAGSKKVLLRGSFPEGDRNTWVMPSKVALQPLQTEEWPIAAYLTAIEKVESQLSDLALAYDKSTQSEAALATLAAAKKAFWLTPTKASLSVLMEAGQEAWEQMRALDLHRVHSAKAYNGWLAAWNVYLLSKPARLCPGCQGEVRVEVEQPDGLQYYNCPRCPARLVSYGNESLDYAA